MENDNNFAPPIALASNFHTPVDIIIPYHGQYEKLNTLLDSIFRLTRSNYYKVYIVDDASPNAQFIKILEKNAARNANVRKIENNIKTLRLNEQRGFAGAIKAGFDISESPHVCFINSDCKIETIHWLRSLGECLLRLKSQNVRMVCPMTNNSVGGHPAQTAKEKFVPTEDVILENGEFLSMYCFLCHRELFNHCGGFIKEYPYGFFEDEEFGARMQHYGFKQAVCGDSWVYHEGQSTIKSIWREKPEIEVIMQEEIRKRCIADMKKLL